MLAASHEDSMKPLNLRAPQDVRDHLQSWAERNCTSMTAELIRSIRERAEREKTAEYKPFMAALNAEREEREKAVQR
ncbi:hypothetical protein AXW67_19645 [Bradyrhizobium neotropicale]|uniref:Arc-like DNA binding domain-containing protein n=2 Tax=Bradyrhizobium neotropicale TaxID=1497615 RepID=A0A176Z189_9BRAD|nr:hypothetical protein AXW67_19645 [Bradyrhizobium neotropicale]